MKIVSFNSSPTYELAKYLDPWFKTATNFKSEYSVINSLDLVNHLQPLKPSLNSILVSFDVIGLFPNVALTTTLHRIQEILSDSYIHKPICDEFMELLKICLFPNFCKFK